jgi:hypothetical protein
MKRKEDDVVWSLPVGEQRLYLYILLEFQSSIDHAMPVRILQYVSALYESLIKSEQVNPANRELPFVLPIVLYNGDSRWRVATNINDLIYDTPSVLKRYQPQLSYFIIDEGSYSEETLGEIQNAVSAVFSLENAKTLESAKLALLRMCRAIQLLPEKQRLDRVISYWVKRHLLRRMPDIDIPETEYLLENVDMLATNIEKWYEQAHSSGISEGISQGINIGKGLLLKQLLSMKFPQANLETYQSRIDNAAEDAILRYSARLLTANSIDEVFNDDSSLSA